MILSSEHDVVSRNPLVEHRGTSSMPNPRGAFAMEYKDIFLDLYNKRNIYRNLHRRNIS